MTGVLWFCTVPYMSKHTDKVYRNQRMYEVTYETQTIPTTQVTNGMQIWEGPAWSSHGMKEGYWSEAVDADDTPEDLIDYYGEEVTVRKAISSRMI